MDNSDKIQPGHGHNTNRTETEAHESYIKHENESSGDIIHESKVNGNYSCAHLTRKQIRIT